LVAAAGAVDRRRLLAAIRRQSLSPTW
jgi:hypothetical protein